MPIQPYLKSRIRKYNKGCDSHNIAELEPRLYKSAALMVAGGDGSSSPGGIPGHRFRMHRVAVGRISGCGAITDEAHTSTHQRITTTPTRRHVSTSHAAQHPENILMNYLSHKVDMDFYARRKLYNTNYMKNTFFFFYNI